MDAFLDLVEEFGSDVVDWVGQEFLGRSDGAAGRATGAGGPGASSPSVSDSNSSDSPAPADSAATLEDLLAPDAEGQINEEELFLALVLDRLSSLVGPEVAQAFREAVEAGILAETRADGYVPYEQVALDALGGLVEQGLLSEADGDRVYSQAFAAAQLDDRTDSLFDGRGGPGDPTVATASYNAALAGAREVLSAFDSGRAAPERSLAEARATGTAPRGGSASGAGGGFLFKPASESDGKLVVLLPPRYTGEVEGVILRGPDGRELESGDARGVANGEREHYRFDRPGGAYPDGLTVEVQLRGGRTVSYEIAETSRRFEK